MMENPNLNFFSDSYKYDISILNNLQVLLIQNQINKEFTLDHSLHSFLEEPFVGKNYVSLTEESVTVYSNDELVRSLNDLIKDYNNLLELFGKVNEERKVLRKYNILLLQKLFSLDFGLQSTTDNDFQNYLNKVIFMNQEFLKKYVRILEEKLSQSALQRDYKDLEVAQLKSQIEKLEKKLISSRENLKQFLINGKVDENTPMIIKTQPTLPLFPSVKNFAISENESAAESEKKEEESNQKKNENRRTTLKPITNANLKKKAPTENNLLRKSLAPKPEEKRVIRTATATGRKPGVKKETSLGKKQKTNLMKKSSIEFNLKTKDKEDPKKQINDKKLVKPGVKKMSASMSTADFSAASKRKETKKPTTNNNNLGKATLIKKKI